MQVVRELQAQRHVVEVLGVSHRIHLQLHSQAVHHAMRARAYAPLAVSAALHLVLLSYANHVDTHPHKFGGLKYTDVDWRVVIDGAAHLFGVREGSKAQGWLNRVLRMDIGE